MNEIKPDDLIYYFKGHTAKKGYDSFKNLSILNF